MRFISPHLPRCRKIAYALIFAITSLGQPLVAQNGPAPLEALDQPGVVLTFDDRGNIPRWVEQIPLFARYGVRATFCIERPDMLTADQIKGLRKLIDAGHEIACHGYRHVRGIKMVEEDGLGFWVEHEILSANEALRKAGIMVTSFAYPNSSNTAEMDAAIEPFFRHVRTGSGIPRGKTMAEADIFFTPLDEVATRFVLTGKGLDRATLQWLEQELFPALERAKARNEILTVYAHDINEHSERHHIRPEMVELILKRMNELGLKSYTLSELPSHYPRPAPDTAR